MLPPLQTVLELTSAHLPPSQQAAISDVAEDGTVDMRAESSVGHLLQDGKGTLADGSTWERVSGEEKGDNGYWCRCALFLRCLSRLVWSRGMSSCCGDSRVHRSDRSRCCRASAP
jgi:hypothetical protein